MNVTTRIAPANSRMMHALTSRQAPPAPALSLQLRDGRTMQFASQAEMAAAVRRMSVSAVGADPNPGQPEPAPAAPNAPPDTAARLDTHDAELADHAARITALEQRLPPPTPVDTGAQATPSAASASAPVSTMVNGTAIYARMNARSTGLKAPAATTAAPAPTMIQTAAGPIVNARAIHDRHNAVAATRADRHR